MFLPRIFSICAAILLIAGCGSFTRNARPIPLAATASARVSASPLAAPTPCIGAFVPHVLDFSTVVAGDAVRLFDSNGAGVAIGDLDGDGRPDLAFANLDGPVAIFWNQGGFNFRKEQLDDTGARAVNIVDVDGDGRPDVVFTHRGGVSYWRNQGGGRLARATLKGVLAPAYAMAWGDLNGDGALDLVTGSYDAELARRDANAFLFSGGGGVYYYQQRPDGSFAARRLARSAQALAIALPDLNGDGRPDILVGNDFAALRDAVWVRAGDGWIEATPFATTSESTMSIDQGDIGNDGRLAIFTTDMKPYDTSVHTLAEWLPMMATMPQVEPRADPQRVQNVLEIRGADGRYHDEAMSRGVDATGWSWSGKFGDLDNDGWLDLYVVNGMIARELFHHLPNDELVERNQALRNQGGGYFTPAPEWGLGSTASGRGMSMADLDGDGRLDVVINNLRAPAQIFENRLCGGDALEVDLRWPASKNSQALGALLTLRTSAGTYTRDVRAGSGYLSGDPTRVHFGIPTGAMPERLEIRWPDGAVSIVDAPRVHTLVTVER